VIGELLDARLGCLALVDVGERPGGPEDLASVIVGEPHETLDPAKLTVLCPQLGLEVRFSGPEIGRAHV
jgi:hypothetical protein